MMCRHCGSELTLTLADLGSAPPSNAYLSKADLQRPEYWLPLKVLVCTSCWLAQTEGGASAEDTFQADYAYFSSYSAGWLRHARDYVDAMVTRFGLSASSTVIEVAANDGYLLRYVKERGIACLGIEPTASTARAARALGIDIIEDFFGVRLARRLLESHRRPDLMVANNVLAHVPDINDFVGGFALLMPPYGVATFEFPHLLRLVTENQFDTIYHEHFSYLSLGTVQTILARNGLTVFDVERVPTHGGSLRVFAQRTDASHQPVAARVAEVLDEETMAGMRTVSFYAGFQARADKVKNDLLAFLIDAKRAGKRVGAYGAAAKGNTLLNYAGVRPDLLPWVADRNPAKIGRYLPGSRIPIVGVQSVKDERPDILLILPWNLQQEVMQQLACVAEWGCAFVTAVPELRVHGARIEP